MRTEKLLTRRQARDRQQVFDAGVGLLTASIPRPSLARDASCAHPTELDAVV